MNKTNEVNFEEILGGAKKAINIKIDDFPDFVDALKKAKKGVKSEIDNFSEDLSKLLETEMSEDAEGSDGTIERRVPVVYINNSVEGLTEIAAEIPGIRKDEVFIDFDENTNIMNIGGVTAEVRAPFENKIEYIRKIKIESIAKVETIEAKLRSGILYIAVTGDAPEKVKKPKIYFL